VCAQIDGHRAVTDADQVRAGQVQLEGAQAAADDPGGAVVVFPARNQLDAVASLRDKGFGPRDPRTELGETAHRQGHVHGEQLADPVARL
jgi:hypothetical protein